MSKLDCENLDSLRLSLERITGLKAKKYEIFLRSFDIYGFYDRHPEFMEPQDVFTFLLTKEFNANLNHKTTCWFHFTRSKRDHQYTQGLLPLNRTIDMLWEELFHLISNRIHKDEWNSFRKLVETDFPHHNANIYRQVISNSNDWGPYGFLAKNLHCFNEHFSTRHYFEAPEIVLDICNCAEEFFKIDLLKPYQEETVPCVVKFEYEDIDVKNIGYALFYWYQIIKEEKISHESNICFSTRGKAISSDRIDVQFLA